MSVTVDTRGITKEMEGKRLRVLFTDGETAEIKLHAVMIRDCHEDCNGFIYYLLSTNQTAKNAATTLEDAIWGKFEEVASIVQLGD